MDNAALRAAEDRHRLPLLLAVTERQLQYGRYCRACFFTSAVRLWSGWTGTRKTALSEFMVRLKTMDSAARWIVLNRQGPEAALAAEERRVRFQKTTASVLAEARTAEAGRRLRASKPPASWKAKISRAYMAQGFAG